MIKNAAGQVIGAQMITIADGSIFTGTVTVYVTGDDGTQAIGSVGSGICTNKGNGYSTYAPAQAETNYSLVAFTFTGTGAISVTVQVFTQIVQQTGDSFTRIGAAGAGLTNIDLPNQTMDITGDLSGSVGSVTGAVGSVTAAVTTDSASRTASKADVSDIPNNSEFNARSLPSADYTIVSDLGVVQTADHTAAIADIPTVSEFNARTIPSANYFDPAADAVANVTLVGTTTTNTDMITVGDVTTGCNDSLNATIPSTPASDSINDYIKRMKFVMVNKMEITEASGDTTIYEDNDSTIYATIAAAYTSDPTTTVRKRLE